MKRSVFLYACLAILFAATAVYQVARARYLFPQWFHQTRPVERPFALDSTPQGFTVSWISSWALKAGIQSGDVLKSINGKLVTGLSIFGQAIVNARPGDVLEITVRPQRAHKLLPEQILWLTIPQAGSRRSSATLLTWLFFVVSPIFCLALGFWVAAVRIRDPLAWLLLALMLWFAAMADPGWNTGNHHWPASARVTTQRWAKAGLSGCFCLESTFQNRFRATAGGPVGNGCDGPSLPRWRSSPSSTPSIPWPPCATTQPSPFCSAWKVG